MVADMVKSMYIQKQTLWLLMNYVNFMTKVGNRKWIKAAQLKMLKKVKTQTEMTFIMNHHKNLSVQAFARLLCLMRTARFL